jgi:hypothetical protein
MRPYIRQAAEVFLGSSTGKEEQYEDADNSATGDVKCESRQGLKAKYTGRDTENRGGESADVF